MNYLLAKQKGLLHHFTEMSTRIGRRVELSSTWVRDTDFKPMKTLYVDGKTVVEYSPEADEETRALHGVSIEDQMDRLEQLILTKIHLDSDVN